MIIKTSWENDMPLNELHIHANLKNKKEVESILLKIEKSQVLPLINPLNNRIVKVEINRISSIESYTQSSIVRVSNEKQEYFIQKRLKELDYLNQYGLFRVNNSVMVNLADVQSFQVIENARLEVSTVDNRSYIVSRHYAKKIKEELSCSNI
ncbi:LytTR family DNA-binding domain-containing protein [Vagococcus elongatus]|uniref:HTH LytTR-type domain-containing protein n=1 Tax=Vagococcus elongatus TaxID=180344 RepID=A0A430B4A3_9ENTE|nr:LytTR family DNA-binding domain-containing protein [Vagococcus elongatus]RSU15196.1 hypothetical protein CBF29_02355 [Vagococcus elongatus]